MDVDPTTVEDRWWRHIPGGGDPHHRPDPPADSRWQRGDVIDAMYFADSEETAWAEWYRSIAEAGIPPDQAMPRDLWRWGVAAERIADLSAPRRLRRVGLAVPRPGQASWAPYQRVGEALWRAGFTGLVAPSAARPKVGQILCLFRPAARMEHAMPIPPPATYQRPPLVPLGLTT